MNEILINSCCSKSDKELEISNSFFNSEVCSNAMKASSNFESLANIKLRKKKIFETKQEEAAFYNYFRIYIESLIKNDMNSNDQQERVKNEKSEEQHTS